MTRRQIAGWLVVIAAVAGALWYLRDPAWVAGQSTGLRPWQQAADGTRYRWSGRHASFFVTSDAARIIVPVATTFRTPADTPMIVTFSIDDSRGTRVLLTNASWTPVTLDMPAQQAYDTTLNLIKKRKWRIVDERPPQPPRREGKIEAVAYTPIMGFSEDIAVRVVPDGDGSRVDLRSSSRYFEHDLGSNAARLTRLIDDINDADDDTSAKPAKKQPTPTSVHQAKGATRR